MKSAVLIGMPGSGKTIVGTIVAKKIGYKFYDTDDLIEKKLGIKISEFLTKNNEEQFRKIETEIIKSLSNKTNVIISTGGGSVLNLHNFDDYNKRNFIFIYLKRDISKLPIDSTRPLVKSYDDLVKLFEIRHKYYEKLSNICINNDSIFNTTRHVIRALKHK